MSDSGHCGASSGTEIVAASLETPAEVVEAVLNGAHHATIPLQLIEEMAEHKLSALAIEEFVRAAAGQTRAQKVIIVWLVCHTP